MIRKQAAMDLERPAGPDGHDSIFVNDQDVDNYLIWCDSTDNGIHGPRPELQGNQPTPTFEERSRSVHADRDWDFFYRSLNGPSANVTKQHTYAEDRTTIRAHPPDSAQSTQASAQAAYGKRYLRHWCPSYHDARKRREPHAKCTQSP